MEEKAASFPCCDWNGGNACLATMYALRDERVRLTRMTNVVVCLHHFPFNIGERGGGDGCRSRTKNRERGTGPVGYVAKDYDGSHIVRITREYTRIPSEKFVLSFFIVFSLKKTFD